MYVVLHHKRPKAATNAFQLISLKGNKRKNDLDRTKKEAKHATECVD